MGHAAAHAARAVHGFLTEHELVTLASEALASQRDELMFRKEAMYGSRRMRSRMAHVNEARDPDSMDAPDYLRRKPAQGKAEPRRRDPR